MTTGAPERAAGDAAMERLSYYVKHEPVRDPSASERQARAVDDLATLQAEREAATARITAVQAESHVLAQEWQARRDTMVRLHDQALAQTVDEMRRTYRAFADAICRELASDIERSRWAENAFVLATETGRALNDALLLPCPAPRAGAQAVEWVVDEGTVKSLERELDKRQARIEELEGAIQWALGAGADFPPREPGQGAYWWRTELRRRAFSPDPVPPEEPPTKTGGSE